VENGAYTDEEMEGMLKITMEQRGCYIEVVVPEVALPSPLQMQEYMRNTGADMYARLYYMMQKKKAGDA